MIRDLRVLASLLLFVACFSPAARIWGEEPKAPPTADEYRRFIEDSPGKQFYGVYIGDKKMGWFSEEQTLGEHAGEEAAIVESRGMIKMQVLGASQTIEFRGLRKYALAGDGSLLYVEDSTSNDGVETLHVAALRDGAFAIETTVGQRKSTRRVDSPKETLRSSLELDRWLSGERQAGDRFESYSVALEEDDVNVKETIVFQERLTVPYGGVPTVVHRVSMSDSRGISFDCDLADDGRMLKGKMGPLDIRIEEAEVAQQLETAILDSLVNIPVDRDLGDPEKVQRLVLEARGLDSFEFPISHRQQLRAAENGAHLLELTRDGRAPEAAPLSEQDREKHLKATPSMQADSPELRELAKEIVGDAEGLAAVDALREWVYRNLKKSMASNSSTALAVLDRKAGDCTEHTLLFVALARAADIPAREVGGVAFTNYGGPIFGWHAWAQIHDGHQWVTVDPTWNQTFVDATHIQLQDDAEDMSWIDLLGELKLKVVEVKTSDE
jgi:hypothetical protein